MNNRIYQRIRQLSTLTTSSNIIILGHQKSGTSAIAALLSKATGLELSSDPLYFVDYGKGIAAYNLLENSEYLYWLGIRHPYLFRKKIIKDPDFIFIYKHLKSLYKNAKYIFVARDPRDTIRSICNRLNLDGKNINSTPNISQFNDINRHWGLILSGKLPELTMDIIDQGYIYNLAHRWNEAANIFLRHSNNIICIKYEDFLKNKESSIEELISSLGYQSKFNIKNDLDIEYQPKGNSQIHWSDFFDEENLKLIDTICEDNINKFGYHLSTSSKSTNEKS